MPRPSSTLVLPRRLALAGLVALACALVSGCGSSGGGDAQSILRQTFGANKSVHSGRLSVDVELNLQGVKALKGPVGLKLDGPFQSRPNGLPRFDLTMGVSASGQSLTAGAVSTGDKGYLRFAGTDYAVSDAQFASFKQGYQQAQANASKQKHTTLSSLGVDPMRWLSNAQKVGTETVGGASTTHIRSNIEVPRLLDDVNSLLGRAGNLGVNGVRQVPRSITPQQRATIQRSVQSATLDVYSGKDDQILRRLTVNLGLTQGTIKFDLLIADLNQSQTINAPTAAQPLSSLLSSLGAGASSGRGGLLGASAGGSGGAGTTTAAPGSSTQSGTPGAGAGQAYLNCLQKAGSNLAAAQKCAALVGR